MNTWVGVFLLLVLGVLAYCLLDVEISIKNKPVRQVPEPPSTFDEWISIYEQMTVVGTDSARGLAVIAAGWIAWDGGTLPDMSWLDDAEPEERLELGALCTRLRTDPQALKRSVEIKGLIFERRQAAARELEEAERRAEIAAVAPKHHNPPELPAGAYAGAQDFLDTQLAATVSIPEPAMPECAHAWKGGMCTKCGADLIPCLCEVSVGQIIQAGIPPSTVVKLYRNSCSRCRPEEWIGWAARQGIPDL